MKARMLLSVIILLLVFSLSFAGDKITIEDTYGTWINSDYNEVYKPAKSIYHSDGTYELYSKVTDTKPAVTGKNTITDSWYDKEGNLLIKNIWVEVGSTGYGIIKCSDSGKVREYVWSGADYPDEVSPIAGNYWIQYRQE